MHRPPTRPAEVLRSPRLQGARIPGGAREPVQQRSVVARAEPRYFVTTNDRRRAKPW